MKKVFLILVVLVFAASAVAQHADEIGLMLEFQKKLELSEAQIKQLMDIQTNLKKFYINEHAKIKVAELELEELMRDAEKNLKAIKTKYQEIAGIQADIHFSDVQAEVDAYKVIKDEQRQEFDALLEKWHLEKAKKEHMEQEHLELLHKGDIEWVEKIGHDAEALEEAHKIGIHIEGEVLKGHEGENVFVIKGEDGEHKVIKVKKVKCEGCSGEHEEGVHQKQKEEEQKEKQKEIEKKKEKN